MPKADPVGVPVDVADVAWIEPEPLVEDLLEGGLVALALVLGPHEHGGAAARGEADLRELGLRPRRLLDGVDHREAPQSPTRPRGLAPGGEAGHVRQAEGAVHAALELAAVVGDPERGAVGHRGGGDQVHPPQGEPIHPELAGRVVDEALDDVGRLGPAGSAVRSGRIGVGQHRVHRNVRGRERVDPDQGRDVAEGREQVAVRGHVGPHVGERLHAQGEEAALGVEGQLGVAHVVARVLVGGDRLPALALPLDRPADLARGPEHEPVLGVLPALGAERPAHVARDHPDLVLRDLEDVAGQRVAHAVRVLDVGVEGVAVLPRVVHPERAARLHVLGVHAGDDVAAPHPVGGPGEGRLGRRLVSELVQVGHVVRALVPDRRGPRLRRGPGVGHRGERLVVDADQVGRVLGLGAGLGHHQGHRIAHVARAVHRQAAVRRREHRGAVGSRALERHLHGAEAVARHVCPGVHREDPGRLPRRVGVDRADPGMGVR